MKRRKVCKRSSQRKFVRSSAVHPRNNPPSVMRGGIRL